MYGGVRDYLELVTMDIMMRNDDGEWFCDFNFRVRIVLSLIVIKVMGYLL